MSAARFLPTLGVLLCLLLVGTLPVAAHHDSRWRWGRETVRVVDRTSHMSGYVAETVGEWNAALAHAGADLRLAYVDGDPVIGCDGVRRVEHAIVVCNVPALVACEGLTGRLGCTALWGTRTRDRRVVRITAAKIVLADVPGQHRNGCHEFGHALGLNHWDADTGSCMTSEVFYTDEPGAHDASALARMYGRE